MRQLEKKFKKNGCLFTQVKREGQKAIFSLAYPDHPERVIGYETVTIKQIPETEMFGKLVEAHEALPGKEEFGRLGWSFSDLEAAEAKLVELKSRMIDTVK